VGWNESAARAALNSCTIVRVWSGIRWYGRVPAVASPGRLEQPGAANSRHDSLAILGYTVMNMVQRQVVEADHGKI